MKKYKIFFISSIFLALFLFSAIMLFGDLLIKNLPLSYNDNTESMFLWIQRKKEINSKCNKGDAVVFLSGSNTLFGINSDYISKEIEKPVLNFGLHGGLGDYIFDFAKTVLKPGNIVVAPVEFDVVVRHKSFSDFKTQYIISEDKEYYRKLGFKDKIGCINFFYNDDLFYALISGSKKESRYSAQRNINCRDNNCRVYSYKYWNKKGDVVFNIGIDDEKMNKLKDSEMGIAYPVRLSPVFLDFAKWCRENDIRLYVTYPVIFPYKNRNSNEAQKYFTAYENEFLKNGINFIGKAQDSFFEYDDFFDTVYHLNQKGVQKRSKYLAKLVKEEILRKISSF